MTRCIGMGCLKKVRIGIHRYYYKHLDQDRLHIVESVIELDALLFLGNEYRLDLAARAGYPSITVSRRSSITLST